MQESVLAQVYRMRGVKACPIETTFRFIGKKWTVLILRELFLGVSQFNRLAENVEGIRPKVLSQRLKELKRSGIVERQITSESPIHVEYRLTELGRRLEPVLCSAAAFSIEALPKLVFKNGKPRDLRAVLGPNVSAVFSIPDGASKSSRFR